MVIHAYPYRGISQKYHGETFSPFCLVTSSLWVKMACCVWTEVKTDYFIFIFSFIYFCYKNLDSELTNNQKQTSFYDNYGFWTLHYSVETPANHSCPFVKNITLVLSWKHSYCWTLCWPFTSLWVHMTGWSLRPKPVIRSGVLQCPCRGRGSLGGITQGCFYCFLTYDGLSSDVNSTYSNLSKIKV